MNWFSRLWGGTGSGSTPSMEAGETRRRLANFRPPKQHINSMILAAGDTVLARARWLARNNPLAKNAVRVFADNLVGTGIVPSWRIDDRVLKVEVQEAWTDWTDQADASGQSDFYGLQYRVARELFLAGECFVRIRRRRPEDGLLVPVQLQVLPAEMLPYDDNRMVSPGLRVRQGIEFDAIGRRLAYHFLRRHPGDMAVDGVSSNEKTRVPAEEVMHIVDVTEEGQLRGTSMLGAVIAKVFFHDSYDDAELERKRIAAMFSVFVTRPANEEGDPFMDGEEDDPSGSALAGLSPGLMQTLLPGEDVRFSEPADVGGSYEAFQYRTQMLIAAGMGVPYSTLTGDMVKANYGNTRAAMIDFRRRAETMQNHCLIYQLCRPVASLWLREAIVTGSVPIPASTFTAAPRLFSRVRWITPKWEWLDPMKDVQAEALAVKHGFTSRSAVIESRGLDPHEVDEQIAADREREKALGLAFGDPTPEPARIAPDAPEGAPDGEDPETANPASEPQQEGGTP